MKKAKNGRVKGNAITGITMAAIMLVFLVTMELMASAEPLPPESYSGLYNTITLGTNPPATSEPKNSIAIFVDTEAYSKLDYEVERLKRILKNLQNSRIWQKSIYRMEQNEG